MQVYLSLSDGMYTDACMVLEGVSGCTSVSSRPSTTPSFLLQHIVGIQECLLQPGARRHRHSPRLGRVAPNDEHGEFYHIDRRVGVHSDFFSVLYMCPL